MLRNVYITRNCRFIDSLRDETLLKRRGVCTAPPLVVLVVCVNVPVPPVRRHKKTHRRRTGPLPSLPPHGPTPYQPPDAAESKRPSTYGLQQQQQQQQLPRLGAGENTSLAKTSRFSLEAMVKLHWEQHARARESLARRDETLPKPDQGVHRPTKSQGKLIRNE